MYWIVDTHNSSQYIDPLLLHNTYYAYIVEPSDVHQYFPKLLKLLSVLFWKVKTTKTTKTGKGCKCTHQAIPSFGVFFMIGRLSVHLDIFHVN